MNDRSIQADAVEALRELTLRELRELHQRSRCPDPRTFPGRAEGTILHPSWAQLPRLWRGKVFEQNESGIGGFNRIGLGPMEFKRYRFVARAGRSAFSERQVLLLDHDQPENPPWVRIFHDELVEARPNVYLVCSHLRIANKLRYLSYFAITFA